MTEREAVDFPAPPADFDREVIVASVDGNVLPIPKGDQLALENEPELFTAFHHVEAELPKLVETDPGYLLYEEIQALYTASQTDLALAKVMELTQMHPYYVSGYIYAGLVMLNHGEYGPRKAIESYLQTLEMIEDLVSGRVPVSLLPPLKAPWSAPHYRRSRNMLHYNLGDCYAKFGEFDLALRHMEASMDQVSGDSLARRHIYAAWLAFKLDKPSQEVQAHMLSARSATSEHCFAVEKALLSHELAGLEQL